MSRNLLISISAILILGTVFCLINELKGAIPERYPLRDGSFEIVPSATDTCGGSTILEARVTVAYDSISYTWYFEGSIIPGNTATIKVREVGEYAVDIYTELDGYAQVTQQGFVVEAPTFPIIEQIRSIPATCGALNGKIIYELAPGSGPVKVIIDGDATPFGNSFQQLAPGEYQLTFTNEAGCTLDSTVWVPQVDCPIYIPNAFSPNGDGVNDTFRISTSSALNANINSCLIFNRWGTQVYEARNFSIHSADGWWNGQFDQYEVSRGVYFYFIEVAFDNGAIKLLQGAVSVL